MILRQYYLGCLAHASYLLADESSGQAAVVDPQRDVDGYLADAESLGCRIEYVFLTHFHADFVAGHLELRDRVGATICVGARAQAEYAFTALGDGDSVALGTCGSSCSSRPATRPSRSRSPSMTPRPTPRRTPCSPVTRYSSATSAGPI